MAMRAPIPLALALLLTACAQAASPPDGVGGPASRPSRSTTPHTRLVLPDARPHGGADPDCADFPDQASAQRALRADPADRWGLDADGDGIACEDGRAPFDRDPVGR